MERGRHRLEFCAVEEGYWRDATPLSVEIAYEPDIERIVARLTEDLVSGDPKRSAAARETLRGMGEEAMAELERRLEEARKAAREASELERAVRELGM